MDSSFVRISLTVFSIIAMLVAVSSSSPNVDNAILFFDVSGWLVLTFLLSAVTIFILGIVPSEFFASSKKRWSISLSMIILLILFGWYQGSNTYAYLADDGIHVKTLTSSEHYEWSEIAYYSVDMLPEYDDDDNADDLDVTVEVWMKDGEGVELTSEIEIDLDVPEQSDTDSLEKESILQRELVKHDIPNKNNDIRMGSYEYALVDRVLTPEPLARFTSLNSVTFQSKLGE